MDDAVRLAFESGRAFTGLRGFDVDPRLWFYVPRDWAEQARVVPMILVGNTLKLAGATADVDLSPLQRRFPNLQFDLMLAAPQEISAVLAESGQDT